MTSHAQFVYDFTKKYDLGGDNIAGNSPDFLRAWCQKNSKKWSFQLEEGEKTGFKHYQGRISLKTKLRFETIKSKFKGFHWSITSKDNTTGESFYSYTTKEDTRIQGPWSDKDKEIYIPKQYQGKINTLLPWQEEVFELADIYCDRTIHYIFDNKGNNGKSTLAHLLRIYKNGIILPIVNDGEKLIQSCCNMLMNKKVLKSVPIVIDLPRAMDKSKLYGMYSAIETIKSGYVYDTRHKYDDWNYDSPNIWIMSNALPDINGLSFDRWKIFHIDDNKELVQLSLDNYEDACLIE